jgi:hypothetical protein
MSYLAAPPRGPRKHYTRGDGESQVLIFLRPVPKAGHFFLFFLAGNLLSLYPMVKMPLQFRLPPASHRTLVSNFTFGCRKIENNENIMHHYHNMHGKNARNQGSRCFETLLRRTFCRGSQGRLQ